MATDTEIYDQAMRSSLTSEDMKMVWTARKVVEPMPGLPADSADRKACPVFSGVYAYFPDALAEIARLSKAGNDKHNPGEPLHWAKEKSTDHDDCIARHQLDVAKGHKFVPEFGSANIRTRAAVAWRALAALQTEIDNEIKDGSK